MNDVNTIHNLLYRSKSTLSKLQKHLGLLQSRVYSVVPVPGNFRIIIELLLLLMAPIRCSSAGNQSTLLAVYEVDLTPSSSPLPH